MEETCDRSTRMEIWVAYGEVESLFTLQAENLGELVDPSPESHVEELVQPLAERMKGAEKVVVLDSKPATLKLLRGLQPSIPHDGPVKVLSPVARQLEDGVPELRGRVLRLSPPAEANVSPDLSDGGRKFVISTGEPDPLFGYLDARASLALLGVSGARKLAYLARDGDEPRPMQANSAHAALMPLVERVQNAAYATVITRGGEPYSVIEGGLADARGHYLSPEVGPAKAVVAGAGGRGYDETLSHSIRGVMNVLKGVRKGGEIVMVAECRDGIGSEALQMHTLGRIGDGLLRKGFYADGMEEVNYANRLREEYSVTLLSTLPELYSGSRLRFRSAKGAGEALTRVFSSVGRSAKLHVFTRAPETILA